MNRKFLALTLAALPAFTLSALAENAEKITYADNVRAVLENKCFSCHNPDKKKGDLDLTSYAGTMTGGGSGSIINAGDPDGSKLITSVLKKEEPFMPPEGSPLGAKDIEILHKWIQGGVLETASSIAKKGAPKANIALVSAPNAKPDGPPPVPENVLLEPIIVAPRGTAVTALAASPWAPLIAVSGMKQALVYDTNTRALAGVYPYPDGYIRSLKFSQNGSFLVAGGGRGGKSGNAVVWDVKTGKRITEVGHEFDQVMCADISPNHGMIAIGSPSKKLKCFNTSTGEELWVVKKHTEWVLQVAFSPDGVLVASADRNGGILISEAPTGGEFYTLDGHKQSCTGLSWRADSNLLASCSEEGKISVWEMQNGKLVKSWDAHGGGVQSVSFMPNGNIVSSGRDGVVRVWDVGGKKLSESKAQGDLVTRVAAVSDGKTVVAGDFTGAVKFWSVDKFDELGAVSSNPGPIAQRIADTERLANELLAQLPQFETGVKQAEDAVKAKEDQLAQEKKKFADAQAFKQKLEGEINGTPAQVEALKKLITETQTKRQTQVEAIRKHEQTLAQVKLMEPKIAQIEKDHQALVAEVTKLTAQEQAPQKAAAEQKAAQKKTELDAQRGQLEAMKKTVATAPEPLVNFDNKIKETSAQIAALVNGKPNKEKEVAGLKKSLDGWPKTIADVEKQLADTKPGVPTAQQKLADLRARLVWAQKQPPFLKAAQFNVNVIAEREKLDKVESDVKNGQEALKEAEAAKIAAAARIEAGKKAIAEATTKLPALDAALAKVKGEFPAVEKILEPTVAQEKDVAAKADAQKKIITDNEGAQKNLEQEKTNRVAAAKKAEEDINKQLAVLQKQGNEINGKAAAPMKTAAEKKNAMAEAEGKLNAAKQKQADAVKLAQQRDAEVKAKQAAKPVDANAVAAAQKSLAEAQAAQKQADTVAQAAQGTFNNAKTAFDSVEKVAAPLRSQQQNIATQVENQNKALAEKRAEPANADKDFAAKSQPLQAAVAAAKAVLAPLEKQLGEIRAKLEADTKIVEAKRADVAKAQSDADGARKAQVDSKKSIENSIKEIADKEKAMVEIKSELATLEPQIAPQRERVKQLGDQYLAMLPK